jgi:hypothetical protein
MSTPDEESLIEDEVTSYVDLNDNDCGVDPLCMAPADRLVFDLDGTLTPYPGDDFRSLYKKYADYVISNPGKEDEAANLSAEVMFNRTEKGQLEKLIATVKRVHLKYGAIFVLSRNHRAVAKAYLEKLGVASCFDLDSSFFRGEFKDKVEGLEKLAAKYEFIIYVDDDLGEVNSMRKKLSAPQYLHLKDGWLGTIDLPF